MHAAYIFSASATPASIGAANAALDIMLSEPERIERLWDVTHYALDGFRKMGCEIGPTTTPIIPLYIRDNENFAVTRIAQRRHFCQSCCVSCCCSRKIRLFVFR